MMEVVLNRLRDFSCKTSTFDDSKPAVQPACRDPQNRSGCPSEQCAAEEQGRKLDLESALAWLRRELMEMRSQDQALIRKLMELHSGIQELKQELSEEEQGGETDEEPEEGSHWDSDSEKGSGNIYSTSGEMVFISCQKMPKHLHLGSLLERPSYRRSSVP